MRTVSHALITVALGKKIKLRRPNLWSFLVGSVLPDLPLLVLSSFTMLTSSSWKVGMQEMHKNYFANPVWIILHNFLHSFVILGVIGLISLFPQNNYWKQQIWWFTAGALLHTFIDIFTHSGDGPLFLFPLSWTIRFNSPISYWDPAHFGKPFTLFEYGLDGLILVYLGINRFLNGKSSKNN